MKYQNCGNSLKHEEIPPFQILCTPHQIYFKFTFFHWNCSIHSFIHSFQLQQNWNEWGNTDDNYDSHDDTEYELQLQEQQLSLQGLQAYQMNLERSRQELKASTLTAKAALLGCATTGTGQGNKHQGNTNARSQYVGCEEEEGWCSGGNDRQVATVAWGTLFWRCCVINFIPTVVLSI